MPLTAATPKTRNPHSLGRIQMMTVKDIQVAARLMRGADLDDMQEAFDTSDVVIAGRYKADKGSPGTAPRKNQKR